MPPTPTTRGTTYGLPSSKPLRSRPRRAVLAGCVRGAERPRAPPTHSATALPGQRTRNRPDEAPGARAAHRDRVPGAARALAGCRRGGHLRGPAAPGLGTGRGRCAGGQERCDQASGASSVTTRGTPDTSSASAASATACPGRKTGEGGSRTGKPRSSGGWCSGWRGP